MEGGARESAGIPRLAERYRNNVANSNDGVPFLFFFYFFLHLKDARYKNKLAPATVERRPRRVPQQLAQDVESEWPQKLESTRDVC